MSLMEQLEQWREEGTVQDIDLELCRFLSQQQEQVAREVLMGAFLVSYLYRAGDVCLLLEKYAGKPVLEEVMDDHTGPAMQAPPLESWLSSLEESPLVGSSGDFTPLILDDTGRLYLHKLWVYEQDLAERLLDRGQRVQDDIEGELLREGLNRLFRDSSEAVDWQQIAAARAVRNPFSVISGGPGTGKTSTVVRVLALLVEQAQARDEKLHIALVAPTGKAAARLKESIVSAKGNLPVSEETAALIPEETMTLHKMLGARRQTSRMKYNRDNPLPYDLIIVDEASMIDQVLMSKLTEALLEHTRLILLGDKDQLASVEAGSVLGDICSLDQNGLSRQAADWLDDLSLKVPEDAILSENGVLADNITLLTKSYRFSAGSGIGQLAGNINSGDTAGAMAVLENEEYEDVQRVEAHRDHEVRDLLWPYLNSYFSVVDGHPPREVLTAFNRFSFLSAHRRGPLGVNYINRRVERLLQQQGLISRYQPWYPGRPVMITRNDHILKLYNGDTGICLPDKQGELNVYFEQDQRVRAISPARLPAHTTAYAITVHKSQGSEFGEVVVMLPLQASRVLSRELLYTAVTRARRNLTLVGRTNIIAAAIKSPLVRASGLRLRLWKQ